MTAHVKICKLTFANVSLWYFDSAFIQTKCDWFFARFESRTIHCVATAQLGYCSSNTRPHIWSSNQWVKCKRRTCYGSLMFMLAVKKFEGGGGWEENEGAGMSPTLASEARNIQCMKSCQNFWNWDSWKLSHFMLASALKQQFNPNWHWNLE